MVKANHALSNSAQAYKSLVRPKLEYGCTLRNKNLHEGGGMRNQRPKATKLANSRKEKTSS